MGEVWLYFWQIPKKLWKKINNPQISTTERSLFNHRCLKYYLKSQQSKLLWNFYNLCERLNKPKDCVDILWKRCYLQHSVALSPSCRKWATPEPAGRSWFVISRATAKSSNVRLSFTCQGSCPTAWPPNLRFSLNFALPKTTTTSAMTQKVIKNRFPKNLAFSLYFVLWPNLKERSCIIIKSPD